MAISSYSILRDGHLWLGGDEKTWVSDFADAACFTSEQLARDIAYRELPNLGMYQVLALVTDSE